MGELGNILIATASDESFHTMERMLKGCYDGLCHARTMAEAKQRIALRGVSLLIVNTPLPDNFGVEAALNIASHLPSLPILLIVKAEAYEQALYRARNADIFVLSRPLSAQNLRETVSMLRSMQKKLHRLELENQRLQKKLDDSSIIMRAKCLLIEKKGMSEEEAHHFIEKRAMDHCHSKREEAQNLLRFLAD